jgi:hypothetical protein
LQKIVTITLVFEKNAIFFAEIWQKSQKIVIITSTPGHPGDDIHMTLGQSFAFGTRHLLPECWLWVQFRNAAQARAHYPTFSISFLGPILFLAKVGIEFK